MPMPRGKREKGNYSSVAGEEGAMSYKEISDLLTKQGSKMNHTSVRNHLLRAMKKIALCVGKRMGRKLTDEEAFAIAKVPDFQLSVAAMIANDARLAKGKHR